MRKLLKCICKSKEDEFNLYGIITVFDFWGFICNCIAQSWRFFNSELQTTSRLEGEVLLRIRQVSFAYRLALSACAVWL